MMLNDRQLFDLIKRRPNLIGGYTLPATLQEAVSKTSALQPSSFDLTVGTIYLPETKATAPGGIDRPLRKWALPPGHTAVVETAETLDMPKDVAAFGFPPARLSVQGLLMTNPGHVDPGYVGKLRFTVINMGKKDLTLEQGQAVATLLFFRIEAASKGWKEFGSSTDRRVTVEDLAPLSADFLDIERRARRAARSYGLSLRHLSIVIPLVAALAAGYVTVFLSGKDSEADIKVLKERIEHLQQSLSVGDLERRVTALEKKVR